MKNRHFNQWVKIALALLILALMFLPHMRLLILADGTATPPVVPASGIQCDNLGGLPAGSTIQLGSVFVGDPTYLVAEDGTYNGNSSRYASISFDITGKIFKHLTYNLAYWGLGDGEIASAWIAVYDANGLLIDSDVKYIGFPGSINLGSWQNYTTKDFAAALGATVLVIIRHDKTSSQPDNNFAVRFDTLCYNNIASPTPSPTPTGLPSPQPTRTPTASLTPSLTLTSSLSPMPTLTPTGTLPTATASEIASSTLTLTTDTPNPGVLSTYIAPTIAPPMGCDDDPNNPCGQSGMFAPVGLPPIATIVAYSPGDHNRTTNA